MKACRNVVLIVMLGACYLSFGAGREYERERLQKQELELRVCRAMEHRNRLAEQMFGN